MNAAAFANVRLLFEAVCDDGTDFLLGGLNFLLRLSMFFSHSTSANFSHRNKKNLYDYESHDLKVKINKVENSVITKC